MDALLALHEAAFGRADRESRLVAALARDHPAYRPDLHVALSDEHTGEPVAAALVLPRRIELRGAEITAGVLAPWCVAPTHRGRGLASELLRATADRACEVGALALVTIGEPGALASAGFGAAFDLHAVHAAADRLPEEAPEDEWRGLAGEDLPALAALLTASNRGTSGAERRDACVPDWEAHAAGSFALVHAPEGEPIAYVRFRVREELEVSECAASGRRGVEATLRLFARLAREHGRLSLLVHAPPTHPVSIALLARGCVQERSRFDDAARMLALDWRGLFEATRQWWAPALGAEVLGLRLEGADSPWLRLSEQGAAWTEAPPELAVDLPRGFAPGLLTGQRCTRELELVPGFEADAHVMRVLRRVFTPSPAAWGYAPVYELADE